MATGFGTTFRSLAIDYAAAKEPARTNQHFSRATGDIADGQLRRQPREEPDGVPEPMNERGGRPE
jgi:hypothetical protein